MSDTVDGKDAGKHRSNLDGEGSAKNEVAAGWGSELGTWGIIEYFK